MAHFFDNGLADFAAYQDTPWARLQYRVASANLQRHLPDQALRVLDVGGGNGVEAVALAAQGHHVTLLDSSPAMVAEARSRAAAQGVSEHVACIEADVSAIPVQWPQPQFDLILCHNVLQYVADIEAVLPALGQASRPGGWLSIICVNRYSQAMRLAVRELDLAAAAASLDATAIVSQVFGTPMRALAAADLLPLLRDAGYTTLGHYGLRCVNDYIVNDRIKDDPTFFAELEKLELAMSGRFPYNLLARLFHLVTCKID